MAQKIAPAKSNIEWRLVRAESLFRDARNTGKTDSIKKRIVVFLGEAM
jgi:hypothetical protein